MSDTAELDFWLRFRKSTGLIGGVSVLLVILASRIGGGFDWTVFFLSGLAVLLAWSRSWMLVPTHLRHAEAEAKEWQRYMESDWRLVDAVSGLSGQELDTLRAIFRKGDDTEARAFLERHFPAFTDADRQDFMRFFCEDFMDTVSAYIDEDGRLRPFD